MSRTPIENERHITQGWLEVDERGNKIVYDWLGNRVGYYNAERGATEDEYHRTLGYSDFATSLVFRNR